MMVHIVFTLCLSVGLASNLACNPGESCSSDDDKVGLLQQKVSTVDSMVAVEECDWQCYLDRYPGLAKVCSRGKNMIGCAKRHWDTHGKKEKRNCKCPPIPTPAPAPAPTEADLTEMILLVGDNDFTTNLTDDALKAIDYERGVTINFNMNNSSGSNDQAMTFTKGDHCIAVFQGANDQNDITSMLGGFIVANVDMCGEQVHAGIAQEMGSFLQTPEYPQFIASLNNPKCKKVTSLGLSMGGSLATLFAFCANKGAMVNGQAIFGPRTDYALVTYAPVALSPTPLYNGQPGIPFVGMRYGVTEEDGGASYLSSIHVDTKDFRLKLLGLFQMIAAATHQPDVAAKMAQVKSQFESLPSEHVEAAFAANILSQPFASQFALAIFQESQSNNVLGESIRGMIPELAASGILSFASDMVNSVGQMFGAKHALQDFQPLPNKLLGEMDATAMEKFSAADAVDFPKADPFQFVFSTLVSPKGWFVNHAVCCYFAGDDNKCANMFQPEPKWRICYNALLVPTASA